MHEAGIAQSIVDTVLKTVEDGRVKERILAVTVVVGAYQGIYPESLEMYFDAAKKGTSLSEARLDVKLRPAVARCEGCGVEEGIEAPILLCPACGGQRHLLSGDELYVESVETEDGQEDT